MHYYPVPDIIAFFASKGYTLMDISCWWECWRCWISVGKYGCAGTVRGAYIFAPDTIKKGGYDGKN